MVIILYPWRFETIHYHLTLTLEPFVDPLGKLGVVHFEEVGKGLTNGEFAGEMEVIVHEIVGVDLNAVLVFVFEKQIVIELLRPLPSQEPLLVVALPGNVKGVVIEDKVGTGEIGHAKLQSKRRATADHNGNA